MKTQHIAVIAIILLIAVYLSVNYDEEHMSGSMQLEMDKCHNKSMQYIQNKGCVSCPRGSIIAPLYNLCLNKNGTVSASGKKTLFIIIGVVIGVLVLSSITVAVFNR